MPVTTVVFLPFQLSYLHQTAKNNHHAASKQVSGPFPFGRSIKISMQTY